MEVLVFRHGPAEERDPGRYRDDRDRPLTKDGRQATRRAARGVAVMIRRPDLVATSPAVRAQQTAEIFVRSFPPAPKLIEWTELSPDSEASGVLGRLGQLPSRVNHVAVVGHEPTLGELIGLSVTGDAISVARLGRAGGALLEFPRSVLPGAARLRWLMDRESLGRLRK